DQVRRDRSQRASSARDMARRWAAQVSRDDGAGRTTGLSAPSPLAGEGRGGGSQERAARVVTPTPDPSPHPPSPEGGLRRTRGGGERRDQRSFGEGLSTGVTLAFAFPDRVAKNRGNGSFVLANG